MRPFEIDIDPIDVDADGIAQSQSPSGAGDLTLNGALASGGIADLDYARRIEIASTGNDSGNTFTIVGTDADGVVQSETVTGPNIGTSTSVLYFKTVTQVSIDGAAVGNITVGTADEIASKTICLDWKSDDPAQLFLDVLGTIDITVEETYDNLKQWNPALGIQQRVDWFDITALADKTADTAGEARVHATACRIIVNSYSSGAEAQLKVSQSQLG